MSAVERRMRSWSIGPPVTMSAVERRMRSWSIGLGLLPIYRGREYRK
jgi:hypothetical protein